MADLPCRAPIYFLTDEEALTMANVLATDSDRPLTIKAAPARQYLVNQARKEATATTT